MDLNKILASVGDERSTKMVQSLMGSAGLNGLIRKLNSGGLQQQISSWVGHGDNQPISAEHVTSALGHENVAKAATHAGVSPQQAAGELAQVLPKFIDKATPDGRLPEEAAGDQQPSPAGARQQHSQAGTRQRSQSGARQHSQGGARQHSQGGTRQHSQGGARQHSKGDTRK